MTQKRHIDFIIIVHKQVLSYISPANHGYLIVEIVSDATIIT